MYCGPSCVPALLEYRKPRGTRYFRDIFVPRAVYMPSRVYYRSIPLATWRAAKYRLISRYPLCNCTLFKYRYARAGSWALCVNLHGYILRARRSRASTCMLRMSVGLRLPQRTPMYGTCTGIHSYNSVPMSRVHFSYWSKSLINTARVFFVPRAAYRYRPSRVPTSRVLS
jgi:hypothetical protein